MSSIFSPTESAQLASMMAVLSPEARDSLRMPPGMDRIIEELLSKQNTPTKYITAIAGADDTELSIAITCLFFQEHEVIPDALAREIYHLHLRPVDAEPEYGTNHAYDDFRDYQIARFLFSATKEKRAEFSHIFARLVRGHSAAEFHGDWREIVDDFRSAEGGKEHMQAKLLQTLAIVRLAERNQMPAIDCYNQACGFAFALAPEQEGLGLFAGEELLRDSDKANQAIGVLTAALEPMRPATPNFGEESGYDGAAAGGGGAASGGGAAAAIGGAAAGGGGARSVDWRAIRATILEEIRGTPRPDQDRDSYKTYSTILEVAPGRKLLLGMEQYLQREPLEGNKFQWDIGKAYVAEAGNIDAEMEHDILGGRHPIREVIRQMLAGENIEQGVRYCERMAPHFEGDNLEDGNRHNVRGIISLVDHHVPTPEAAAGARRLLIPVLDNANSNEEQIGSLRDYLQKTSGRDLLIEPPSRSRHPETGSLREGSISLSFAPAAGVHDLFAASFALIDQSLEEGSAFVHCTEGMSRSTTLVTAYLMNRYRLTKEQALEYVARKRSIIEPKEPFHRLLEAYESLLREEGHYERV